MTDSKTKGKAKQKQKLNGSKVRQERNEGHDITVVLDKGKYEMRARRCRMYSV